MIRNVKARFDRNCSWAEHIARTDATHIEKWSWTKGIEVSKSARAQRWTKKVRLERTKESLRLNESGQLPNLVFSHEKPFQIEQFVNKQNDPVYLPKRSAENLHLRLPIRTQAPPIADGRPPLLFFDRGVKINAKYYGEKCFKDSIEALSRQTFWPQTMYIRTGLSTR